jgi:hypothetical protein
MEKIIDQPTVILSKTSDWFEQLKKFTPDLTEELVLRNVIDKKTVDRLLHLSDVALKELCKYRSFEYGFRLWHNDDQKNVHFVNRTIFENPPKEDENIQTWMQRAFPDKEICIIMNNVEHFSDEFAVLLSRFFQPVHDEIGIPMNGLHSTSIFGNYGFTPLGIHHDTKGSFVMNLHLGPGIKKMYIWQWGQFIALGGKTNEKNIEKYLPHAKVHTLYPGDLFFMPWNKFHVGYTEGYSLSMTNWFDFHTAKRLLQDLMTFMNSQFISVKEDFLSGSVTEHNFHQKFDELINKFDFEGQRDNKSLKENLVDAHDFKMFKTFSNCGWKGVPMTRHFQEGLALTDYELIKGKVIRAVYPFKIYQKRVDNTLYVISRGYTSRFPYDLKLEDIVHDLCTFDSLSVDDLVSRRPDNWSEETLLYFILLLYNFRAIEIL